MTRVVDVGILRDLTGNPPLKGKEDRKKYVEQGVYRIQARQLWGAGRRVWRPSSCSRRAGEDVGGVHRAKYAIYIMYQ
mgnify:CR=1